jgi:hypothetical protein
MEAVVADVEMLYLQLSVRDAERYENSVTHAWPRY